EVLKGPQGTLYGASSLGGVVRVISKKPDLNAYSGSVKVEGSTVDGGDEGYGVRGSLNAPLIDGQLAVRLSGIYRRLPGYVDNGFTGTKNYNDGDTYGGRLAMLWRPITALSVELTGMYQDTNVNGLNYTSAIPNTLTPLVGRNVYLSTLD